MAKFHGQENLMSDLGNWNSANIYSISEISRPLAMTTVYRDLAKHGTSSFIEDLLMVYEVPKDEARYNGMVYLVSELLKIIENSKAFLKVKGTKEEVEGYKQKLIKIEKLLKTEELCSIQRDVKGNHLLSLKEPFERVLDIVLQIREDIKLPLNKNDLIFINKESFDPKEYKKKIMEDATNKG